MHYDSRVTKLIHRSEDDYTDVVEVLFPDAEVKSFAPDFETYGRKAPSIRNREMVSHLYERRMGDSCGCDDVLVIAFSGGVEVMSLILEANIQNLPIIEFIHGIPHYRGIK